MELRRYVIGMPRLAETGRRWPQRLGSHRAATAGSPRLPMGSTDSLRLKVSNWRTQRLRALIPKDGAHARPDQGVACAPTSGRSRVLRDPLQPLQLGLLAMPSGVPA